MNALPVVQAVIKFSFSSIIQRQQQRNGAGKSANQLSKPNDEQSSKTLKCELIDSFDPDILSDITASAGGKGALLRHSSVARICVPLGRAANSPPKCCSGLRIDRKKRQRT
jgi:hypothetical protein